MRFLDSMARALLPLLHLGLIAGLALRRSHQPSVLGLYSWSAIILIVFLALLLSLWPFAFRRWRTKPGPNTSSIVLGLGVLVLVVEGLPLRPWVGERDGRFHPHLQIIFGRSPDAPAPLPTGYRTGSLPLTKDASECRVVLMGGSTALNLELKPEESIATLMERHLQEALPGRSVRVVNAANVWFSTHHTLINYLQRARALEPDAVVAFEAVNDMYRSFSPPDAAQGPFREDYSHFLGPQIDLFKRANSGAWTHSNLRFLCTEVLFTLPFEKRPALREPGSWPWPSLPVFRRNLEALASLTQADGIPLVLGTQAHLLRQGMPQSEQGLLVIHEGLMRQTDKGPDVDEAARAFDLFNGATREVCSSRSVPLADLDAIIPRDTRHFHDDVHLTAEGARLAAAEIVRVLLPALKTR
ncbi:MAG: SGNH/GDSL hydrolase family protein [Planctomycetota bacterium]